MDAGKEFEFNQAQLDLDDIKTKLRDYLLLTYKTEKDAEATYIYLEGIVSRICKSQDYTLSFGGGSPLWHARVLYLLGKWVNLENKVGVLISREANSGDASF